MLGHSILSTTALIAGCAVSHAAAKAVFAHVVAGNSGSYSYDDWTSNIGQAKAAGIDGFIMNIAPNTYQLEQQLDDVYGAAAALGGFNVFMSFDYLGGSSPWAAADVETLLNKYNSQSAQYRYNGLPVVTTFEGTGNAGDWPGIKDNTGGLFFMPDYSSLGATTAVSQPAVDGLSSWVAWPDGPNDMTNGSDIWYLNSLAGKPYMAPVSPWFYANVNNENEVYRGDSLWYDRWEEIIEFQPDLVQIVTWNDFGESHYVGPLPPRGANAIPGSETYTDSHPHQGWLADLPYFISMYKTGQPPSSYNEHATIAYRLNPSSSGSDGGTVCHGTSTYPPASYSPAQCSQDQVNINVLTSASSTVTASIDGQGKQTWTTQPGMNFFALPFDGLIGAPVVEVTRDGQTFASVTGEAIANANSINWNAWVGTS